MKLSTMKLILVAGVVSLSVTACTTSLSSGTYTTSGATQMQQAVSGTVVSARLVEVANDQNTVGTLTGAALGGIAGSQIGGGTASNVAGGIGGAVIGGLIGNQVEKQITKQTAMEYVVKLRNGSMVSVVQDPNPTFYRGQRVMVVYGGGRPRVIPAG